MAAYAALASLSQTINKHRSLFSADVEEKVRSIHDCVIFMLLFLENCPEKAKGWESKMRDIAHETEDITEGFMWQQSYNRWIKPSYVKFVGQLEDLMENFCLMVGDMMDEPPAHSPVFASPPSSSSRVAATTKVAVVGLEGDLLAIKGRLCRLPSKLQIIPIVGMGGVGKTTLARNLYDDPLIVGHSDIRVWLTISQDYSEKVMFSDLLDSMKLLGDKSSTEGMKLKVYQHLKGRRYLIVMDDVWSPKVWDDVRNIFPDDGNGSRIMLTTRLSDLAGYPDSDSPHHKMRLMDDSQCWDLLERKVFANSNCPPELEDAGKGIARNCVGLPLAVVLVAGILSEIDKTQSSWEEISKNVKPVVGEELEGILSLSYMHLPHHLRPCFLYMGAYPEDKEICASTIIRLWVAEGFLKHQNGGSKSLEEEAEEYLEDLVKRNLVIVTKWKSDEKIKCFSLHDMVREMCIRKAHDEKFFRVMDRGVIPEGMINERRISFRHSDLDRVWCPTIRTILCFPFEEYLSLPASSECIIRLVRVLDAVGDKSKDLPVQVFELFHLRYLALTCSSDIPSSISNLTHLQTLIIIDHPTNHHEERLFEVPNYVPDFSLPPEIWRMPQLRHLVFSTSYNISNPPLGSTLPLENLQTLWGVESLVCSKRILKLIPNIKRLRITYHMNEDYKLDNLVHLSKLQVLEVTTFRELSWQRPHLRFPCTLKKLSLSGTRLPWKDMAVVGALLNLEVLKLLDSACDGDTWETNDGEFLQLKFLLIEDSNLKHWITETSHFPRLQSLVLRGCVALSQIPEDLGDILTLELIEVDIWNESLINSAKQIQQDHLENYGNNTLQVRCIYREKPTSLLNPIPTPGL